MERGRIIQKTLDLKVVELGFTKDIKECLSRVESAHKGRTEGTIGSPIKNAITGIGQS